MLPLLLPIVGVDLAKSAFQLAVADGSWRVVDSDRLTRTQFERWFANRGGESGGDGSVWLGPQLGALAERSRDRGATAAGDLHPCLRQARRPMLLMPAPCSKPRAVPKSLQ